jgi:hypothetical protein
VAFGTAGTVASGVSGSIACVCPAVSADDTIMFVASQDSSTASATSGPSGFTSRAALTCSADGHRMWVYWKNALGSEGGSTLTLTSNDAAAGWRCVAVTYTGRSTSTPAAATTGTNNTAASNPTMNVSAGQTPAAANCDAFYAAVCDHTDGGGTAVTYAPPSGFAERVDTDDTHFIGLTIDDKVNTAVATGIVGGVASTPTSSGGYMAVLILLEAAAAGGGGSTAAVVRLQSRPFPFAPGSSWMSGRL